LGPFLVVATFPTRKAGRVMVVVVEPMVMVVMVMAMVMMVGVS
jgi:hypothetical protein